mgnify:CR=1 FL=1
MKRFIYWPGFLCFIALVLFIAWLVNGSFGSGFWITFGIAIVAILINGVIATVEDNRSGGFNNPHRSDQKSSIK